MRKFTGIQYLQIDIASNYGLDKAKWEERLQWFEDHKYCLMEMLATAETPALYYAGVKAYEAALSGQSSGYPISLDATSSGLQLLSALTCDRKAAEICNVINRSIDGVVERADGYTIVYHTMLDEIGEEGKIERNDVKQAVMTALYGSKAVPKEVFGEGMLLQCFYDTMKKVAPTAWELNEAFLDIWNPDALVNSWTLPDNFHVHVKVMSQMKETVHWMNQPFDTFYHVNAPMEEGRSLGANTIHSLDGMIVREISRRCDYDMTRVIDLYEIMDCFIVGEADCDDEDSKIVKILWSHYEESGYLSARIIDHLHAHNMRLVDQSVIKALLDSLPVKPFKVMAIHDCFRCLPNYGNDLRQQYNLQLMLIAKSNLLSYLISQIIKREVNLGKDDEDLWKDIADTEYALS